MSDTLLRRSSLLDKDITDNLPMRYNKNKANVDGIMEFPAALGIFMRKAAEIGLPEYDRASESPLQYIEGMRNAGTLTEADAGLIT
jgi:hypothetical protein